MKLDKKTVVPELLRWLIKPRPRLRIPRKEAAANGDHALRRPPPPPLYGFDFQSSYSYFASLYFFSGSPQSADGGLPQLQTRHRRRWWHR